MWHTRHPYLGRRLIRANDHKKVLNLGTIGPRLKRPGEPYPDESPLMNEAVQSFDDALA
jgi:hypothetical protein